MLRTYLCFRALESLTRACRVSLRSVALPRALRARRAPAAPRQVAHLPHEARPGPDAEIVRWLYVRASLQFATLHRARLATGAAPCTEHALTAGTLQQRHGHLPIVHVRTGDETR